MVQQKRHWNILTPSALLRHRERRKKKPGKLLITENIASQRVKYITLHYENRLFILTNYPRDTGELEPIPAVLWYTLERSRV